MNDNGSDEQNTRTEPEGTARQAPACKRCGGLGDVHYLTCATLRLPANYRLSDLARTR